MQGRLERARALYREDNVQDALARAHRLLSDLDVTTETAEPALSAIIGATWTLIGLCETTREAEEPARRACTEAVRWFEAAGPALIGHGDYIGDHGIALQLSGAPGAAERLLREALDLGEDTPDVRRHLGACLLALGQLDEATAVLDDAVRRAPLDWQAWLLRAETREQSDVIAPETVAVAWLDAGRALEDGGLSDRAVWAYRRAETLAPEDVSVLIALGRALLLSGRPGEAVETLDLAARTGPRVEVHILAANALGSVGSYDEALRHAEAAVSIDPHSADAAAAHAAALYQHGDYPAALEAADRALAWSTPLSSTTSSALMVRGFAHLSLGEHQDAIEAFSQADQVTSGDPYVLEVLGQAYLEIADVANAMAAFDRAIAVDPDAPSPYFSRANLRLQLGEPESARDDLEQLVRLEPANGYALGQLANVLLLTSEPELALARIDEALSLEPTWAWALTRRGDVLAALERLQEAVESYREALNLQPDLIDAIFGLVDVLLTRGTDDMDDIMAILRAALESNPRSATLHALNGELLRRQDQAAEALVSLDRALELEPDYAYALATRGQVLLRSDGELDRALSDLTRARDLEPEQLWIRAELARAFQSGDLLAEAAVELSAALEIEPDNADLRAQMAEIAIADGRADDAVRELGRAVELEPTVGWMWESLANALRRAERLDEAIDAADRAVSLDADSISALVTRGQALYDANRFEEAAEQFEDAASRDPHELFIRSALGESYRCLGRLDEAVKILSSVLTDQPADPDSLASRGAAYRARGSLDLAIKDLTQAWQLDRTSLFAFSNLGLALTASGRADEAVSLFRQVPEDLQKKAEWQREYAAALQSSGHHRKALRVLDNALWSHPDDVATIRALGWTLLNLRQPEDALSTFQRAFALAPDDPDVLTDVVEALSRMGRHAEALAKIRPALQIRPDDRWVLTSQCQLLAEIGEWEAAAVAGRAAVQHQAADPTPYLALAWAAEHLDSGAAEALSASAEAVRLDASGRWARKSRANAYWLLGRNDEARADYQWILDEGRLIDHPDSDEWYLQAWCHYRLGSFQRAAYAYARALRTADLRAGIHFDLGLSLFCDGQDENAHDAYERGLTAIRTEGDLRARGTLSVAIHDLATVGGRDARLLQRKLVANTVQRLHSQLDRFPLPDDLKR